MKLSTEIQHTIKVSLDRFVTHFVNGQFFGPSCMYFSRPL